MADFLYILFVLNVYSVSRSVWRKNIRQNYCPVASHGKGKFISPSKHTMIDSTSWGLSLEYDMGNKHFSRWDSIQKSTVVNVDLQFFLGFRCSSAILGVWLFGMVLLGCIKPSRGGRCRVLLHCSRPSRGGWCSEGSLCVGALSPLEEGYFMEVVVGLYLESV